jgi:hypothetical protein
MCATLAELFVEGDLDRSGLAGLPTRERRRSVSQ